MPQRRKKQTVLDRAKRKKGAQAQSKQIQTLARQVDSLKDSTRELSIPVNWHCGYKSRTDAYPLIVPLTSGPKSGTGGTAVTNNTPLDIMNWVKWGSFPGGAVNNQKGNLKLYSQYVDMILEPGGEVDLTNHVIFVVQLRDDNEGMARQTYIRTGGMMSMSQDLDYTENPDARGSQVWLNPQLYRIHKRFEAFTAGSTSALGAVEDAALAGVRNHSGGMNRFGFKLTYGGRHLRATERSAEVQSITYEDIPPEYKYFIVAFSDNSRLDLENPSLSVHATIHTRQF